MVQSGAIQGDVVFNSPSAPVSQESAELRRRWEERQRRVLDSEDAQRTEAQHTFTRYLRVVRAKRRWNVFFLLIEGLAVMLCHLHVVPVTVEVLGLLFGAISVFGWVSCTVTLRRAEAGRAIRIPRSRWMW